MAAQVPAAPGLHPGALPKRTTLRTHHTTTTTTSSSSSSNTNSNSSTKLQEHPKKVVPSTRSAPLLPRLNGTVYQPAQPTAQPTAPSQSDPAPRVHTRVRPTTTRNAALSSGGAAPSSSADERMLEAQAEALRWQVEADAARLPAPTGRHKHSHLSRPPHIDTTQVADQQVEIARALEATVETDRIDADVKANAASQLSPDDEDDDDNDDDDDDDEDDDDADSVPDDFEFLRTIDPGRQVCLPEDLELAAADKALQVRMQYEWTTIRPRAAAQEGERLRLLASNQLPAHVAEHEDDLAAAGVDPDEARDTTMVAEYTEEILAYLGRCEKRSMANPNYMDHQKEIEWGMRSTLIDWLLQVHARYHMLPETIWIAINILDRFLSLRVVALAKLQLLGVTALFIAAKYEEILAPSVDEFVIVTDGSCTRDEILKGERIILEALSFNVSGYTSPYPFLRRISKADEYDTHSRTLAKFLMELTLLDHRFLRARPRTVAAMAMFLSRRMLGCNWDRACVYYSGQVEEQLVPAANLVLERLLEPGLESLFVFYKYTKRAYLCAATYARDWAQLNHRDVTAAAAPASASSATLVHASSSTATVVH